MNSLLLIDQTGIIEEPSILEHLHATLKSKVGDTLKCTILNSGLTTGEILFLDKKICKLKLGPITSSNAPWFNLVIGISRPQTSKKILEHATTFGVQNIHFFKSTLSEKSYLDSKIFLKEECESYLRAGLSQSAIYSTLPLVKVDKFNPAQSYENAPQKFILNLKESKSFLDYAPEIDFNLPITLAIGPERGFVSEDLQRFDSAGFKSVKISSSILRVEHAIYSAVSQLELLRGRY